MINAFTNAAANTGNVRQPLSKELETVDLLFSMFFSMIPNPDNKILQDGIKVYDKTLADPIVTGSTGTIFESINALEYRILFDDKNKKIVDMFYEILTNLFSKELRREILMALLYGSQYIDLIWGDYNGYFVPVDFTIKAHESFFYKKDKETKRVELFVKTEAEPFNGELVPQYKVLVPRYNTSPDNPYGKGLLSNCYKSVFIKNNAWNFWSMFVEDHGTPKIDAEISSQLAKQLKDEYHWSDDLILAKIQEATETLRQNGVFTHFEGLKVAALATGNSDTGTTHLDLMNYCDMQNSILLLGHNGSSQATPGKLGNDTTALTILDIRRAAYANFVSNKLNSLLQWIYEINFGAGKAPEIEFYEKSDIATYKAKAEFVQILTATGVQFNDDFYQDEFNIDKKYFKSGPAPAAQIPGKETPPVDPPADDPNVDDPTVDDKQPAKVKNKTAAYMKADVAKDAADDDLITLEKFGEYIQETKDFKDANDTLIDAIVSFVDKANSYEEMLHNLYDLFPNMPIDGLKDMVTRLLLVTRTFGNSTEGAGE